MRDESAVGDVAPDREILSADAFACDGDREDPLVDHHDLRADGDGDDAERDGTDGPAKESGEEHHGNVPAVLRAVACQHERRV